MVKSILGRAKAVIHTTRTIPFFGKLKGHFCNICSTSVSIFWAGYLNWVDACVERRRGDLCSRYRKH